MSKAKKTVALPTADKFAALVVSDIHAIDTDPTSSSAASYVSARQIAADTIKDPLGELRNTINSGVPKPDCIICPGDLADKSNPSALSYVWNELSAIAKSLGDVPLIATPGNHDLDSRFKISDYDARGQIMAVRPRVPWDDHRNYLEFWAEHFSIRRVGPARIVALNSAAYHGYGKSEKSEYEHGRVTQRTVQNIEQRLKEGASDCGFNILVCHHHLVRNNEISEVDYSQMVGGDELLAMIGCGSYGTWLVIHGHKHRPRLFYAGGGGSAPVILGAASFSFNVNQDATNKSPNQFHLVTLDSRKAEAIGQGIAGEVRSWDWDYGRGWRRAQQNRGLPTRAGFGHRGDAASVALAIDKLLREKNLSSINWPELVSYIPTVDCLLPQDAELLRQTLKSRFGLNIIDPEGVPLQVGREFSGVANAYKTSA
ncbi:metallophosphoesterase family protein [Hyphomicrobium facile]|uniref:Calcineurin-like phosphoesterase n=1 Tax=Hyphomicrobium facile TaxID=51670 RepID=A0A1I7NDZ5_9HYPH|nr:metallophosphoesterase [Hyphomicrobium facile]SFV32908.1 Calcineurin-like phosphoesterase [Hyphomicrobium facile]